MNFYKGRVNQMLQTEANRQRMYSNSRASEVNTDGTLQKSIVKNSITQKDKDIIEDLIQKGEISDSIASGYGGGTPITIAKTGKDIKENIPAILSTLTAQKLLIESQLTTLQQQSGIVPTNPTSRKYANVVPFLRYEYSITEPKYVNGNYEPATDQNTICSKYNSLVWIYNDILDDIDATNILAQNLEDSKKYNLSVSQLIALNFK